MIIHIGIVIIITVTIIIIVIIILFIIIQRKTGTFVPFVFFFSFSVQWRLSKRYLCSGIRMRRLLEQQDGPGVTCTSDFK